MKFTELIHPEIVLGLRGEKSIIDFYREFSKNLFISEGKIFLESNPGDSYEKLLLSDEIFRKHYLLTQHFKKHNSKVYYINKDLIDALSSIDKEIPLDILPTEFSGYILFEKDCVFDEEGPIEGGYVSITKGKNSGILDKYKESTVFWTSYIPDRFIKKFFGISALLCELKPERLSGILSETPSRDVRLFETIPTPEQINEKRNKIWRILLNTVILLHSKDPKIDRCLPAANLGLSKKELKRRRIDLNLTKIPIYEVERDFLSQRSFSCEKTFVRAHFRWQRVGKELREIKLVLVSEHERKFKS